MAVIGTGLYAGFCFAYAITVTRGLSALTDDGYVAAMRALNAATPSVPFAAIFAGSAVLLVLALAAQRRSRPAAPLLGAALLCYLGAVAVTLLGNVPLNGRLAGDGDPAALRQLFEEPWNTYHAIRTGLALVAFGLAAATAVWPSRSRSLHHGSSRRVTSRVDHEVPGVYTPANGTLSS